MSKQQSGNYEEMPVTGLVVVEEREDLRDPCLRLLVPELRRDGVQELLEVDVALACRRLFLSQDVEFFFSCFRRISGRSILMDSKCNSNEISASNGDISIILTVVTKKSMRSLDSSSQE